jgi:hypothetical protein
VSAQPEVERRKKIALAAIKAAYGTEAQEYGTTLFVSHHLEELDAEYWNRHTQTPTPEPARVLDLLVLQGHWSDEDEEGLDVFDFTLPDDVTDNVISVRFDEAGEVEDISMES